MKLHMMLSGKYSVIFLSPEAVPARLFIFTPIQPLNLNSVYVFFFSCALQLVKVRVYKWSKKYKSKQKSVTQMKLSDNEAVSDDD